MKLFLSRRFFANAYFESHKTTSGTVRDVLVSQDFRRVRLPRPRSIRELVGESTLALIPLIVGQLSDLYLLT